MEKEIKDVGKIAELCKSKSSYYFIQIKSKDPMNQHSVNFYNKICDDLKKAGIEFSLFIGDDFNIRVDRIDCTPLYLVNGKKYSRKKFYELLIDTIHKYHDSTKKPLPDIRQSFKHILDQIDNAGRYVFVDKFFDTTIFEIVRNGKPHKEKTNDRTNKK